MLVRTYKLQPKWRYTWEYTALSGKTYRVSVDYQGNWACSCKGWIFNKHCHHIDEAKIEYELGLITNRRSEDDTNR